MDVTQHQRHLAFNLRLLGLDGVEEDVVVHVSSGRLFDDDVDEDAAFVQRVLLNAVQVQGASVGKDAADGGLHAGVVGGQELGHREAAEPHHNGSLQSIFRQLHEVNISCNGDLWVNSIRPLKVKFTSAGGHTWRVEVTGFAHAEWPRLWGQTAAVVTFNVKVVRMKISDDVTSELTLNHVRHDADVTRFRWVVVEIFDVYLDGEGGGHGGGAPIGDPDLYRVGGNRLPVELNARHHHSRILSDLEYIRVVHQLVPEHNGEKTWGFEVIHQKINRLISVINKNAFQ